MAAIPQTGATKLSLGRSLSVAIWASFVLRLAGSANGALIGIYLAWIFTSGQYDMNPQITGFLIAAYYATELILASPLGTLSDKLGRKFFMVAGPSCGALAVLIHPLSVLPEVQFVARLLEGLASALAIPATLSFLSETTAKSQALRARAITLYEIATVVGIAAGYALGPQLWSIFENSTNFGPNAFRFLTVLYIIGILSQYFGLEESVVRRHDDPLLNEEQEKQEEAPAVPSAAPVVITHGGQHGFRRTLETYGRLIRSPRVLALVPAWICTNAIVGLWTGHSSYLLKLNLAGSDQVLVRGVSLTDMSLLFGAFGIIFLLGMWFWSLQFTRIRKTSIMLIGTIGTFILCAAIYAGNHRTGDTLLIPILAVFLVAVFLQSGITPAALAYLSDISEDFAEDRGTIMGLYSVFLGTGQLLGSGLGGFFAYRMLFDGVILYTFILGLIALFAVLFLHNQDKPVEIHTHSFETHSSTAGS